MLTKYHVDQEREEDKMGLLDDIKDEAKKSGQSKGKFIYFREGDKKRVRFLTDMEDGLQIPFHDSFTKGVNIPCQELFGRDCEYCEDDELRTRNLYAWSVYDYETKEVKILMQAVNNCTAIPAIMALYENYGTLLDRDLVITRTGKGQSTTYSVVPMDKNKFRNPKAKQLSNKSILKYLDQAYPADDNDNDEDDSYEPKKKSKPKKTSKKQHDDEEYNYNEMSPKELYQLCEEREIEAEPKMKVKYYIDLLEEYDEENADDAPWDEDDEDDDVDYSDMSTKELYQLCKERDIECRPKKTPKYYINLLEEYDKAHDDWDEEEYDEDDEDDWEDEE